MLLTQAYKDIPLAAIQAIQEVITKDEGGWVLSRESDGSDGGWTYAGMTARTYGMYFYAPAYEGVTAYISGTVSIAQDFKQSIVRVYYANFFPAIAEVLSDGETIQGMYLSCAINCGPGGFHSVMADSIKRNVTFQTAWKDRYLEICRQNPAKLKDLAGWINRVWRYLP